jgi:ATP-dependent exoDNAse (exonuclease V) alpha subunit
MIEELKTVILDDDIPDTNLRNGDVGTVVHVHANGAAYEVEFVSPDGNEMTVVTLEANQVRLNG